MKNYKYLIPNGKDYDVKQFMGFAVIIVVLWVFIALAMVIWSDYKKTGIGILVVLLLGFIFAKTARKGGPKIIMNGDKPESLELLYSKFKKPLVFPFQDIQSFELRKMYYTRILIHVELLAVVKADGKIKSIPVSQALRVKPMQELLNEIEDLKGIG
ncbi:hypothetical protein [Soonwooa sp.]|uniref:hypothetical protein n=1 Tax=Soonwooa sp. TaxID=1938592 RepID=UPI00262850E1|nr:hypothetical protein [Soonwooa sp.]